MASAISFTKRYAVLVLAIGLAALAACLIIARGHYHVFVIHTGSMGNTIPTRSAVIVDNGHYHLGQVISFKVHGEVVTHRFVAVNANGTLSTQGDANATVDPWQVGRDQVIGGVVSAPRMLGFWLHYLQDPYGAISAVLLVLVVYLLWGSFSEPTPDPVQPMTSS